MPLRCAVYADTPPIRGATARASAAENNNQLMNSTTLLRHCCRSGAQLRERHMRVTLRCYAHTRHALININIGDVAL